MVVIRVWVSFMVVPSYGRVMIAMNVAKSRVVNIRVGYLSLKPDISRQFTCGLRNKVSRSHRATSYKLGGYQIASTKSQVAFPPINSLLVAVMASLAYTLRAETVTISLLTY